MRLRNLFYLAISVFLLGALLENALALDIDLKGTSLAPDAKAKAEVKRKEGQSTIKFRAKNLPPASLLRREVSTYVLWSFDPVRQEYFNLGEVRVGSSGDEKGKAETVTRTALKRFRLLVTAEPNVNVSRPSDLEVLRSKK